MSDLETTLRPGVAYEVLDCEERVGFAFWYEQINLIPDGIEDFLRFASKKARVAEIHADRDGIHLVCYVTGVKHKRYESGQHDVMLNRGSAVLFAEEDTLVCRALHPLSLEGRYCFREIEVPK